jgi:hypothetical protein
MSSEEIVIGTVLFEHDLSESQIMLWLIAWA